MSVQQRVMYGTRSEQKRAIRHLAALDGPRKVAGGRKLKKQRLQKKFWAAVANYLWVFDGE